MNLAIIAAAALALGWVAVCVRVDAITRKRDEHKMNWRVLTGQWVLREIKNEKLMLVIMADKREVGKDVALVEFACATCSLRFWTEVGKRLPPRFCPHCGIEFTKIQKARNDLCKVN